MRAKNLREDGSATNINLHTCVVSPGGTVKDSKMENVWNIREDSPYYISSIERKNGESRMVRRGPPAVSSLMVFAEVLQ